MFFIYYQKKMELSTLLNNHPETMGEFVMKITEFATQQLLETAGATQCLSEREKHLIGLVVTTTRGCIYCTGGRLKKALDASIPYETLIAAVDLAAAVNAGVTVSIAIQGAELNGIVTPGCKDCGCGTK